jgi:flagellar basal-body rod modification protein FlgD
MDLGARPAGALAGTWDGRTDSGLLAPAGTYSMEVSARDANGTPVTVTQDMTGTVIGVLFDKGYPELQLDSGAKAPISDLVGVGLSAS